MTESLTQALGKIEAFGDFLCEGAVPRPGSEYAAESGELTGVQTWSAAVEAGLSGLDHLHYFADTTIKARRVTAFASFTVLRSAISAVALAGWLISGDRTERLTRTLTLRRLEASNQITAVDEIINAPRGPAESAYARKRREQATKKRADLLAVQNTIDEDAVRLELDLAKITRMPRDWQLVKIAADLVDPAEYHDFGASRESVLTWRVLSAYAHGQIWAANMSARTVVDPDGIHMTTWAPDRDFLMQGFTAAWDLMYGAFDRYIDLAGAR
ncbi:hypothetical protein [Nocardia testacea]|uniref:Uncharacterized protein n=1 Tax=Nocardia testacea TaxID=248551 RepID=A0ABW7W0E2_9NOCA